MPAPHNLISPPSTANLPSTPRSAQSQPLPGTIPSSAWKTPAGATMARVSGQEVAGCSPTHAHQRGQLTYGARSDMRLIALALTTATPTPIIPARRSPQPSLRLLLLLTFAVTPQLHITTYFISAIKKTHRTQPGTGAPPEQHLLHQPVSRPQG